MHQHSKHQPKPKEIKRQRRQQLHERQHQKPVFPQPDSLPFKREG